MTRIIGLLSWYDEQPEFLYNAIRSLGKLPAAHLIAVDGAYGLYEGGKARSSIAQYQAIHDAAHSLDMGCTIHTPQRVWAGNEVEKRSALFRYGDLVAKPNENWFYVFDADVFVKHADLGTLLDTAKLDVAQAGVSEPHPDPKLEVRTFKVPMLFRAIPGIRVEGHHFGYVTPDGRNVWGNAANEDLEPQLDLSAVLEVEHMTHFRSVERKRAQDAYYDARDEQHVETFVCGLDGCEDAAKFPLPVHWHPNDGGFVAEWVWACRAHRVVMASRGRKELAAHIGWNRAAGYYRRRLWLTGSDDLAVEHRHGPRPVAA